MNISEKANNWIDKIFPEEELAQWLFAIPTFFIAYAFIVTVHKSAQKLVLKNKDKRPWMEFVSVFLSTTHWPFFVAFSLYLSMLVSPISYEYKTWFNRAFGLAVIFQLGLWGNTILKYLFKDVLAREADASKMTVLRAISVAARMALWCGIFLLVLDNFGVNITTLVAGLGIGGIAVALGVQKIVGDIFASLSIVMDKPFVIGDFIVVDEHKGNVEDIGIKTTRIRSINGERIIFSNSDLLESRIRNYTQMQRRRVEIVIGVTYETPVEKVRLAVKLIEEGVNKAGNTFFELAHFNKFADSALEITVAYWINDQSDGKFFSTQEDVCFQILESFNKNGIEFAYPTQRQYFDSSTLEKLSRPN